MMLLNLAGREKMTEILFIGGFVAGRLNWLPNALDRMLHGLTTWAAFYAIMFLLVMSVALILTLGGQRDYPLLVFIAFASFTGVLSWVTVETLYVTLHWTKLSEQHASALLEETRRNREEILPLLAAYNSLFPFAAIIPISALTGDGIERIVDTLRDLLPAGPPLYPLDIPTDAAERFIVAEMIREKIFLHTEQEVPYATAVLVDSFKENDRTGLITIHATIYVEKGSHKGIVIGKEGSRLKQIGREARQDIEALLGQKVLLKLWVKIRRWTRDPHLLRELGF